MYDDRVATEALDLEAHTAQDASQGLYLLVLGLGEANGEREKQPLTRLAALLERSAQPLEQDSLVCRVLVDDDQTLARLREDVGVQHLPEARPLLEHRDRIGRHLVGRGPATGNAVSHGSRRR